MAETPTTPVATETPQAAPAPLTDTAAAALLYKDTPEAVEAKAPAPAEPSGEVNPPTASEGEGEDKEPIVAAPEEKKEEVKAETDAEKPAPLTPDSYTLTLPEGFKVDDALMAKAKDAFVAAKIDPSLAQPLIDLYAEAAKSQNDANQAAWEDQTTKWRTELNAMPEFSGAMRKTSRETIGRLIDEYGGDDLRSLVVNSGLGDHPKLMLAFLKLGNALTEGAPSPQGGPAPQGRNGRPALGATPGQIIYESGGPGSNPN